MTIFSRGKSSPYASDRSSEGVGQQHISRLGQEAAQDLCSKNCNVAFKDRMSIAQGDAGPTGAQKPLDQMASAAADGADLGNSIDGDDAKALLEIKPCAELLESLASKDREAAVQAAVMNPELQTAGTHTNDVAFNEDVKNRLRGPGAAAA